MKYSLKSIIERYNSKEDMNFIFFWGNDENAGLITKSCLSQWYPCPFVVEDEIYNTAEQYMMAQKALLFDDKQSHGRIMESFDPRECKKLGRSVRNFDEVVWKKSRYQIVLTGNVAKFSQEPLLRDYLLSTKDSVLAEASAYDRIWGIGLSEDNPAVKDPNNWEGENLLGFALMETRDFLAN